MANELVLAATRPEHVLLLSPFLVSELCRVLRYERLRAVHGLDEAGIDQYVANLLLVAEFVVPFGEPTAVVPGDPDDNPVIATATVGAADVLCTKDRHLLRDDVIAHCATNGVDVIDDAELLQRLK